MKDPVKRSAKTEAAEQISNVEEGWTETAVWIFDEAGRQEDDNEFTKDIKIQLSKNGFMCNREFKSQLDTTNFISIIK